jgi:hypothetical protein
MTSIGKALLFGVAVWLIPFVVAFLIFPLRESSRALFESIMPVAVAGATAAFGVVYMARVSRGFAREGVLLGCLWLAICVAIDAPLMLFGGPMHMTIPEYLADIGVTYLVIPAITTGLGLVLERTARRDSAGLDVRPR